MRLFWHNLASIDFVDGRGKVSRRSGSFCKVCVFGFIFFPFTSCESDVVVANQHRSRKK